MGNSFSGSISSGVFTVSEITNCLKDLIEGNFDSVTIEGEISNFRPSSSGHVYFSLKDDKSIISAVMFSFDFRSLNFRPQEGTLVRAKGKLSVYAARGNYQIIVKSMEQSGEGRILQMLEERKRRFFEEGLFAPENKKPLPFFPKVIGVVTSPTGAALQDVKNITRRRNSLVSLLVLPCLVQGSEAAPTIAKMIHIANVHKLCDVLIVGRGGGSLEDLLPFSEECVVRAIYESEIPVISAVGHEIDNALSDYAADVRAPTPSAAAELATPVLEDIFRTIKKCEDELEHAVVSKLDKMKTLVNSFSTDTLEMRFRSIAQPIYQKFDSLKEDLLFNMQNRIDVTKQKIDVCVQSLEMGNPKAIFARGYSMVRDSSSGKIIRRPQDTKPGNIIEIIPAEGSFSATVN